jgi:putative DNA primase/helicase
VNYPTFSGEINPGQTDSAPAANRAAPPAAEEARLLTENVLANSSPYVPHDPWVIANAFAAGLAGDHGGTIPVRFHRGRWFTWNGGRYKAAGDGEIETAVRVAADEWFLRVARRLHGKKSPVKDGMVTNALAALKAVRGVTVPKDTPAPCWADEHPPRDAGDVIVFRNGILDVGRGGEFRPATPALFNHQVLDFEYDSAATSPTWEQVVEQILGPDPFGSDALGSDALVSFWQEWCGYCLVADTKYEKAVLLYGKGGNGKSTLIAPLESVMGSANRSSLGLDQFGDRFSLPLTEGKLVNICADQGGVTIDGKAEGNLKRFISGEPIATERKGLDVFDLTPTAKLIVAANNWPRFKDKSDAFPMRFIVIELTRTFRDAGGDNKGLRTPAFWMKERAGFVNWALAGLKRLRARGRFEVPAEAEAAARKCWASKSASYFLRRYVRQADEARVGIDDLYRKYEAQTKAAGYAACDKATFGKAVHAIYPIKGGRLLKDEGRDTAYVGIEFVKDGV